MVLALILSLSFEADTACSSKLRDHVLGYLVIMSTCVVLEAAIAWVSMRGSILDTVPRHSMQYLLYTRLGAFCGVCT